jgi:thiamine biosynthesis lipoprotein
MATRFEVVLHGPDSARLRAAADEALEEIHRWEDALSLYRPHTDLARINARASIEPVRVRPLVFQLLKHARNLTRETGGAFDPTVAPLMRAWGFLGGNGSRPDAETLDAARDAIGWHRIELLDDICSVRFLHPGAMLDLGSIGKGFALDRAAELLREAGITSGLIHGGTSTVIAIGSPPGENAWTVALPSVPEANYSGAKIDLRDETLSVSGVHGKAFREGARLYGHVIDPRTGEPVAKALLAAVALPSATDSDALSTALLVDGCEGIKSLEILRPASRIWVVSPSPEPNRERPG